ncbi:MAG: hypothetical protein KA171_13570 [Reyranella sp.]|nr:hypothetical protein [Reyranella sp.]
MSIFERILRSAGYAFAGLFALLFIGVAVVPLRDGAAKAVGVLRLADDCLPLD